MKFTEYFFCCACLFNNSLIESIIKAAVKVAGLTLGRDVIVPVHDLTLMTVVRGSCSRRCRIQSFAGGADVDYAMRAARSGLRRAHRRCI